MRNEPGLPVLLDRAPVSDGRSETFAPVGERRAYAAPGESLTFAVLTRAGRELIVTLTTQPVFDLALSAPVARRIRRTVRHRGGESALTSLARRTLEPGDLESIDLQTLGKGRDLLRLGAHDSGVLPAFWRTVAAGGGYAPACVELQNQIAPAALLVEIMGGSNTRRPRPCGRRWRSSGRGRPRSSCTSHPTRRRPGGSRRSAPNACSSISPGWNTSTRGPGGRRRS